MPKYRVPYLSRGRIHVIIHNDISLTNFHG